MTIGFSVFGGLLALLVAATVLLTLLPKQDPPSGLGECTTPISLPSNVYGLLRLASFVCIGPLLLEGVGVGGGGGVLTAESKPKKLCTPMRSAPGQCIKQRLGRNFLVTSKSTFAATRAWSHLLILIYPCKYTTVNSAGSHPPPLGSYLKNRFGRRAWRASSSGSTLQKAALPELGLDNTEQ